MRPAPWWRISSTLPNLHRHNKWDFHSLRQRRVGTNQARYSNASAFFPPVPPAVLPGAAFVLLGAAFFLSFYFSTCVSSN